MDSLGEIMTNLKNKRIFISGGAGVIGQELVKKLWEQKAILLVGDLKPAPTVYLGKGIIYRPGDLNNMTSSELHNFAPEVIFHLAATYERSTESKEFWHENWWDNTILSHYLLNITSDVKTIKKIIFASSYLIYDPMIYLSPNVPEGSADIWELFDKNPRNLCGASKYYHEKEIEFLCPFYGINYAIARIFRVYGKGCNSIISRWIRALLKDEPIHVYKPENMFDFIYSEEVANGLVQLLNDNATGIYNLGNGVSRSIFDVLKILKQYFPSMNIIMENSDDPYYEASLANMELMERQFGFKPKIQLEEGIPMIIDHERKRI